MERVQLIESVHPPGSNSPGKSEVTHRDQPERRAGESGEGADQMFWFIV